MSGKYITFSAKMVLAFVCMLVLGCSEGNGEMKYDGGREGLQSNEPVGDSVASEASSTRKKEDSKVVVGAEVLLLEKMSLVKGKKVAVVSNHTALLSDGRHLVDALVEAGVQVVKVFAPEHGFRGDQDAGKQIKDGKDAKTGLPLVSLYGKNKKPSAAQIQDVDVILFDIQDVGARFYTYISTMSYVMEACAENRKLFVVLDRPNPNGWYVDGPVMQKGFTSFVGMHEGVPTVHGMTVGEYASMVNYEGWLKNGVKAGLEVVKCKNYRHEMKWEETGLTWIAPSPNLATEYAAYLYPMLCWFEGMPVSIGRGTDHAFTQFGAPWHEGYHYQVKRDSVLEAEEAGIVDLYGLKMEYLKFTPRSIPGKSTHPKFEKEACFGAKFVNRVEGKELFLAGLSLLVNLKQEKENTGYSKALFQPFFDKLVGNDQLKRQIFKGQKPEEIYESWRGDVGDFVALRGKYLLYD